MHFGERLIIQPVQHIVGGIAPGKATGAGVGGPCKVHGAGVTVNRWNVAGTTTACPSRGDLRSNTRPRWWCTGLFSGCNSSHSDREPARDSAWYLRRYWGHSEG